MEQYKKHHECMFINILTWLNYKQFVDDIMSCEYIITSTLHGLIMALIYKKKVIYTQFTNKVRGGDFKFNDFFESIKTTYNIVKYTDKDLLKNIVQYDKNEILKLGLSMINYYPILDQPRKLELTNIWNNYWLN
jgi:pyruvyltransferase